MRAKNVFLAKRLQLNGEIQTGRQKEAQEKREWFLFDLNLAKKMIRIGKILSPVVNYGLFLEI